MGFICCPPHLSARSQVSKRLENDTLSLEEGDDPRVELLLFDTTNQNNPVHLHRDVSDVVEL